ncbi:15-hydroxyprostaglandin dehydrogenase [NAD(+)]-like [Orbicella faveolata]|uniref:15-hydroxyprostaglandin dehydrogenase [NAD(+)]-like n=1 Tax=Orbicella faveolata TaxID=48498 RepID=UPI0009E493F1|nr:15-hydroxyprostaglandin dehydrogenase [NAD(+)]-like [Orbicella faveolata]
MKIQGSVAIVTGGAQGIGEKICTALLDRGCKVVILDVQREKGCQLEERLKRRYGSEKVIFITCDVTSKFQMKDSFRKTKETFGQINIVCNNAGILGQNESDAWEKVVDVNLKGVILGTFLGVLHMGQSHGGSGGVIINVASMAAIFPMGPDQAVYTATKAGVCGFSQSAGGLKDTEGIRVNCICPSFTETELVLPLLGHGLSGEKNLEYRDLVLEQGLISPELIASGVIQLIENDNNNGAVMMVTKKRGIEFMRPRKSRKSKL